MHLHLHKAFFIVIHFLVLNTNAKILFSILFSVSIMDIYISICAYMGCLKWIQKTNKIYTEIYA